VIAFKSGLAYALTMDPSQGIQGALVASFLTILGTVVIFSLNLHFLMLRGVADSYVLFVPGQMPPMGDFTELAVRVVAGSFALGIQLAAPFIVYAMIFNISLGIMARLMPALPIFFVVMPLQIWVAFGLLGVTLAVTVEFFAGYFESQIVELLILQ
jgi:flagellar biosynthetic protein FliR